jgi:hypothetical protein
MLLRLLLAVLNMLIPGGGTLLAGIPVPGILQLLLWIFALLLSFTGLPVLISVAFYLLAAVWAVSSILFGYNRYEAPSVIITDREGA